MLTTNEFEQLLSKVTKKTTVESLLKTIKKSFIKDSDNSNKESELTKSITGSRNMDDCKHVIHPNRQDPSDDLSKRERKVGFKLATEQRSIEVDESRTKNVRKTV